MNHETTPKCKECGQLMFEIGGIGKDEQLGEMRKVVGYEFDLWTQTGVREQKLYQCPEDKTIAIY